MARVAVVGVGAIGGVVAALLQTTGHHELTLCTRRPLDGLMVNTPDGVVSVKATNLTQSALAGAVDWVLVATKAYDAKGAAEWLSPLCKGGAPVAVLQNGVEHRERFANHVSTERILPVVIDCPAERQRDGRVLQRGAVRMQVEASGLGKEFAQLFAEANAKVELTDDFITAAWRKLCVNSAGAISALVAKPSGVLHDRAQPPDSINSMLADRLAGRPMEIDARNGVIVRKGEKHRIRTPSNRMAVALLRALRRGSILI
jgi:2-dehydropantoate 2-reductase